MGVHSVVWLCWLHDRRDDAPVQVHPKALDSTRGQFLPDESQIWATSGVIKKPWGAGGGKTVDSITFLWVSDNVVPQDEKPVWVSLVR